MRSVTTLSGLLALLAALPSPAACPPPGDLAPGRPSFDGSAWIVTGDERSTVADAVVLVSLETGHRGLAPLACRRPDDVAPGVTRDGSWTPSRNDILDTCDHLILRDLVLGRLVADEDPALDADTVGGGTFAALRDAEAATSGGSMSDDALLARAADLLEAADAAPSGAQLLQAWLEGHVLDGCSLPPLPSGRVAAPAGGIAQPQGQPVVDLARLHATASWHVLRQLVEASEFTEDGVPLARQRGLLLSAVALTVRVEALDAWHRGAISPEALDVVLGLAPSNPYKAWRALLEALGQPTPSWAGDAHDECMRGCEPEACAGGGDEDDDGLTDCEDGDCSSTAACDVPLLPGPDGPATVALLHADDVAGPDCLRDESGKRWDAASAGPPSCDPAMPRFGAGALHFDGTQAATSVSEDFAFGTDDFTIDWHARVDPGGSQPYQAHRRMVCLGSTQMSLQVATEWSQASGKVALWAGDGTQWLVLEQAGSTDILGAWHHVALVRSGTTLRVFVDGRAEIVAPIPAGWTVAGEPRVTLGHMHGSNDGYLMEGWMDEIRVTKGLARWEADFIPPDRPAEGQAQGPDSAGTIALLHFDGVEGSATFPDETGRTWTAASGGVRITQDEARLGAGGLRLTGTPGLVTSASPDFDFGTGDFTIEAWAWFDATDASWDFVAARGTDGASIMQLYRYGDTLWFHDAATIGNMSASGIVARQWQHLAVTRAAGTFRMFIDGRLVGESHHAGAVTDAGADFGLGWRPSEPWGFKGYLDEVRIARGVARYVADFTPMTEPFEPDGTGGLVPGTLVLLHGDGTPGSDTLEDATGRTWTPQAGGPVIDAAAHFGSGSLRFERGRYMTTPASPDFDFGTGDFTIDAWVRFDSTGSEFDMVVGRGYGDAERFLLYRWQDVLYFYDPAAGNLGGPGLVAGTWHHCAVTRHDGTFRVFIDGRVVGGGTSGGATLGGGEPFMVGQQPIYPYGLSANIDELRIVKGTAVWTGPFTPPARAYGWP